MPVFLALAAGALGALAGPFLARGATVLPGRWPTGDDLRGRAEQRPARGRSAACTVAGAMLFALAAVHWGLTLRLPPHLLLFAVLIVVSAIDLEHSLIPDRVVFPAFGLSIVVTAFVSMALGTPGALVAAALGAAAYSAGLLAVHLLNPSGLGFGDVKVALLLGWYLGWSATAAGDALLLVLVALLVASLAGSFVGVALLVRHGPGAHYPFGPWLALGTVAVLLLTPPLS